MRQIAARSRGLEHDLHCHRCSHPSLACRLATPLPNKAINQDNYQRLIISNMMYSRTFPACLSRSVDSSGVSFLRNSKKTLNYKCEQINQCRADIAGYECCWLNCAASRREIDQFPPSTAEMSQPQNECSDSLKSFLDFRLQTQAHSASFQCLSLTHDKGKGGVANQFKVFPCLASSRQLRHILICNTSRHSAPAASDTQSSFYGVDYTELLTDSQAGAGVRVQDLEREH